MKHAPAPWKKVLKNNQYEIIDSNGDCILELTYLNGDAENTVTLATAAPELLEALEALHAYMGAEGLIGKMRRRDFEYYIKTARAAIAKAKGE